MGHSARSLEFGELVIYDAARRALAEAHRVDEVLGIKNKATAMQAYARQAHDRELELWAAEIRLRAQRRGGELLAEMKKNGERANIGGDGRNQHTRGSQSGCTTLADLGITRGESSKWQKLAAIPEADFEASIANALNGNVLVTASDMLGAGALRQQSLNQYRENLESITAMKAKQLSGRFDVFDIDPAWPVGEVTNGHSKTTRVGPRYPAMTLDEIRTEVGELLRRHAQPDCHIFLWTLARFIWEAKAMMDDWNIRVICPFVWRKAAQFGVFNLPQLNCEFCLYGRIGSPQFIDTRDFPLCFDAPRGKHSEKPDIWYQRLARVTAGRRLAMFSRRVIEGFEGWGKEAPGDES
jgi:N6-adenosine-specific RNA methylase IME4